LGKPLDRIPWQAFDRQLDAMVRHRVGAVTHFDPQYPSYLRDLPQRPPLLFYRGDLSILNRRGVAIVGTRQASVHGLAFSESLAADLAGMSIVTASGIARGIDSAAHRGSLRRKGPTVGVAGTGLDIPYPPENGGLYDAIAAGGCLISEQLMGTSPRKHVFPRRNRLISAVSRAVVVVEAGERSGALLTVRWALEQGREVGAVPGFPGDFRSRGVNGLLKAGAFLVEGAGDILEAVPLLAEGIAGGAGAIARAPEAGSTIESGMQAPGSISPGARRVLRVLTGQPADADGLAEHLQDEISLVQQSLLELEMLGLVEKDATGYFHKA
jgi:DNA processing protein